MKAALRLDTRPYRGYTPAVPSVYELKPRFQAFLRPLLGRIVALGVTPNHITLAALAGSFAVGGLLVTARRPGLLAVLPVWLFLRMALNALDGMAAREYAMATRLGAVLNELGDVLSDLALYAPLARVYGAALPAAAFCVGAALTEFCGVLSQALGAGRRYDGPMGKSDRAFWIGALALAGACFPGTLRWWPALLTVLAALCGPTCLRRLAPAVRGKRP